MDDFIRIDTVLRMKCSSQDKELGLSRVFTREEIASWDMAGAAIKQHLADEVARQFLMALNEAQVRVTDAN